MRQTALNGKQASGLKKTFALAVAASSLALLASCVPNDGPLASRVVKAGADKTVTIAETGIIFDVIQVDQRVANSVTALGQPSSRPSASAARPARR